MNDNDSSPFAYFVLRSLYTEFFEYERQCRFVEVGFEEQDTQSKKRRYFNQLILSHIFKCPEGFFQILYFIL